MTTESLSTRMRRLEWFHGLRALPEAWMILRVDGRNFSRLTANGWEKPFDARFHGLMIEVSRALLTELQGLFVYTESDEASLLLSYQSDLFDREVEKLVSLSASVATGAFSVALGRPVQFDGRLWMGANTGQVIDYFRWRQDDAARCCLNGWCYWSLRNEGQTVEQATKALLGRGTSWKNEMLFERGINFNDLPAWQRRGTGVYWQNVEQQGKNSKSGRTVTTTRRRACVNEDLPRGKSFGAFVGALLGDA